MRALLLAAGFGTRLRPLTDQVPKCLVPINDVPLLANWLENLQLAGIGPVAVNTHYLAEKVSAFVAMSSYAANVRLIYEPKLLGTAGTLKANIDFFNSNDGLLIHADNYCNPDFSAFTHAHKTRPAGCLMTMMTFRTDSPTTCGIVELDSRGIVVGFHEKVSAPPGNLANGGIYILSKEFLQAFRTEFPLAVDFSTEVLPHLIGQIHTYETSEVFLDIGTPANYAEANRISSQIT